MRTIKRFTKPFQFVLNQDLEKMLDVLSEENQSSKGQIIRDLIIKAYRQLMKSR